MLQLTYTSCRPGMSVSGSGGYTVRAASAKLDRAWLTSAPQLARYDVTTSPSCTAGARLAFQRRDSATLITHSVRVQDYEARSASFTHAIIDPSGTLGPADAVALWGSLFWKRADENGPMDLPILQTLPSDGLLIAANVQRHLQDERSYAMARFTLTAWLRRIGQPIILLADAEQVATVVWLLTRCLPPCALHELSFATQDHDPLTAGVAIVGCSRINGCLPPAARAGRSWFDWASGQSSGQQTAPCVEFICHNARAGNWQEVGAFASLCSDLQIDGLDEIDLVHRVLHESHICTREQFLEAQRRPALVRWLLEDARHVEVAVAAATSCAPADQTTLDLSRRLLELAADPTPVACTIAAHQPHTVFSLLLTDGTAARRLDIDAILDRLLSTGAMQTQHLAVPDMAPYWGMLLRGRHADMVAAEILRLSVMEHTLPQVLDGLRAAVRVASLSVAMAGALRRRIGLLEALSDASTTWADPAEIMAAIAQVPQADRRPTVQRLLPALAEIIAAQPPAMACHNLAMLLELVATELPCSAAIALRAFSRAALANNRLLSDTNLATTALALAFGAVGPHLPSDVARDQMVDLGVELVHLYARAGGPSLNGWLEQQAMHWPEPARTVFRLERRRQHINGPLRARLVRARASLPQTKP
ncbi:MAG: hypothetical protein WD042_11695 [Phycisphaeraceae bacterium]